jgi:hypothetical protein
MDGSILGWMSLAKHGWDLPERLKRLTGKANVAAALGSIPPYPQKQWNLRGRQMKLVSNKVL